MHKGTWDTLQAWVCVFWLVAATMTYDTIQAQNNQEVDLPPELVTRYEVLIAEIRCPKCLNINIADSNAPIAEDLRTFVKKKLLEGQSNASIKAFLRDRYGNFIDYNPPFSPMTLVLWILPIVLLISAGLVFTFIGSKRHSIELSDEEKARLQRLKPQRLS